ncbi:MAG: hypothetical protein HOP29_00310 [Phycisphaerales bacterium]|nr:hypothetical protein [Phycisphaerales bacterium]
MNWQTLISLAVVGMAGGFLVYTFYRSVAKRRGGSGCGHCGGERSDHGAVRKPFVPIEQIGRSGDKDV